MISFFRNANSGYYVVGHSQPLADKDLVKLSWLFGESNPVPSYEIIGEFVGPRKEMISPWSTNAVEITDSMGIIGIDRIEEFKPKSVVQLPYDPMLQEEYHILDQEIFSFDRPVDTIELVDDIQSYNLSHGLALSIEELNYLEQLSQRLGRKLTDSEVFGFSQVNSEHCRHKIFNGRFIINDRPQQRTLFELIKATSKANGGNLVSAYKDNVAFVKGPNVEQFAPASPKKAEFFQTQRFDSVLSLKAETHNFPTTVEPFNGASTGTGGEIRDRMAGGKASFPLAGTAVYMTSYPRLDRSWEKGTARTWLYQSPLEILIKASNGVSDFGNKFGQPLICGSLLTFEHLGQNIYGFDKVIMLAGGVGLGKMKDSLKGTPSPGDRIVVLGGDNYRIGMGGGAVSSVATGQLDNSIELNAVQRANPEMQKRVANAIRAIAEATINPIISIHDHGAGGHLNCLSELVEKVGGVVHIDQLPVGDNTLSDKEIIANESQERMGLILKEEDISLLKQVADRERAPMYVVGETTGNGDLRFENGSDESKAIDLRVEHLFGNSPQTVIQDEDLPFSLSPLSYDAKLFIQYLKTVLQLEAVACKDWLTNKVDRSVTGRVATQQTTGPLQLPLNNLGVAALDYSSLQGIATSIGHAPAVAIIDPEAGSRLAVARALTNLVWAPLRGGVEGVSLSANWMWPANNPGENARLFRAVRSLSEFAIKLGISVPTGKDSLSMTQKYPDGTVVYSPGTVIVSTVAEVSDVRGTVTPCLVKGMASELIYIDFSGNEQKLGGSSFAQSLNLLGNEAPDIKSAPDFKLKFEVLQTLLQEGRILAGHDISAGGLITSLLELTFTQDDIGLDLDLTTLEGSDSCEVLFSENPGVIIQVQRGHLISDWLTRKNIHHHTIGRPTSGPSVKIKLKEESVELDIAQMRDIWYQTSYRLDAHQTTEGYAKQRYFNYKHQSLSYKFPENFSGHLNDHGIKHAGYSYGVKAAIIREKGVNGDREMAYSMYLAGFDVKDIHMTDLVTGRETLEDLNFIVFVGGFSNSDVLGSAKGWAGSFLFNQQAKSSLEKFYRREDTLSLGVCNGCQLMAELNLLYPDHSERIKLIPNSSGKFESSFLNVDIPVNQSIMLGSLAGTRLGIWVAHGEGQFSIPLEEDRYHITSRYTYSEYPGNPNGSRYDVAAVCSDDGRHLAMMPHLERSIFSWQWPDYPVDRQRDLVTPWFEAFANARRWVLRFP